MAFDLCQQIAAKCWFWSLQLGVSLRDEGGERVGGGGGGMDAVR